MAKFVDAHLDANLNVKDCCAKHPEDSEAVGPAGDAGYVDGFCFVVALDHDIGGLSEESIHIYQFLPMTDII